MILKFFERYNLWPVELCNNFTLTELIVKEATSKLSYALQPSSIKVLLQMHSRNNYHIYEANIKFEGRLKKCYPSYCYVPFDSSHLGQKFIWRQRIILFLVIMLIHDGKFGYVNIIQSKHVTHQFFRFHSFAGDDWPVNWPMRLWSTAWVNEPR